MKRHVVLVGFMAAGKSTIGSKLARALGCAFVDTDAAIAAEHGPIPAIFATRGELEFRALEHAAARAALAAPPCVVALGGGAVTFEPTRVLVAGTATRVYLEASAATILKRVKRSRTARPVLGDSPTLERIEALLAQRAPYYLAADVIVRVDGRAMRDITLEIVERLTEAGAFAA